MTSLIGRIPSIGRPLLKRGDKVRFVSPASPPNRDAVLRCAGALESWGLRVDFGRHAFAVNGYLAGSDEQRLDDLNAALRDREVRAVFATRGGKGSYRIADRLDFEGARRDPKPIVGFSDIVALQLALFRNAGVPAIHGALVEADGRFGGENAASLHRLLMAGEPLTVRARGDEMTSMLTTTGAVQGTLLGGNLDTLATAAGWALPSLHNAILMIEATRMHVGHVDRQLTMLRKAGHLDGLKAVAVGQFTGFEVSRVMTVVELLRHHLGALGVPLLGGLPLGHGRDPVAVPVGREAVLNATSGDLTVGL